MTDDEFMIGVRERLTNNEQILIATQNEFAYISIEELEKGIKVKKEHMGVSSMTDKERIIIQGKLYNPCNGCELWDGEYCTGDKSYEPNGKIHGIICDRHIAEQFWKVRNELIHKVQECDFWKHQAELGSETTDRLAKQLEEKEQEREELKEYIQANKPTGICETCTAQALIQNDKYRKALNEIEKVCLKDTYTFADGTQIRYDTLDDILNIIDKVKKE